MNILNEIKNKYELYITNSGLHIINYIKIIEINNDMIGVLVYKHILNVKGKNILISKMDENEMFIKGNIKGIDFIDYD